MTIDRMISHDPSNDISQDVSCHLLMYRDLAYNAPRLIFLDLSHNPPCCLITFPTRNLSHFHRPTIISHSLSHLSPLYSFTLSESLSFWMSCPSLYLDPFSYLWPLSFSWSRVTLLYLVSLYLHNSPDLSQFLTISITIGSHYPIVSLSLFLTLTHSITISHSHLTLPSLPWSLLWSPHVLTLLLCIKIVSYFTSPFQDFPHDFFSLSLPTLHDIHISLW